jgi:hypothetical protein
MPTKQEQNEEIPESVSCSIIRCAGCGKVHIALLDDDEEPITEMTLDDDDVIRMAVQLLRSVFPAVNAEQLIDRIKSALGPLQ